MQDPGRINPSMTVVLRKEKKRDFKGLGDIDKYISAIEVCKKNYISKIIIFFNHIYIDILYY